MNERVKFLMQTLDLTEDEALEMLADDEKIEQGEKLFEQTAEQKANSKKASAIGSRKSGTVKREKKTNPDRKYLIKCLQGAVEQFLPKVVNDECQIDFVYKNVEYSVKLIAHRPKK